PRDDGLNHYRHQTILYRITDQIQSLLGRRVPQKKRNKNGEIRETKSKNKQQTERQESYQNRTKR
ncbi:hypothetical protein N4844_15670, partial [Enterococcus faecalis]|uniref:hypothetical protein n=1 Tax=Enterococcus faecalis TaxID=1351 RepID=UPI0021DFD45D